MREVGEGCDAASGKWHFAVCLFCLFRSTVL